SGRTACPEPIRSSSARKPAARAGICARAALAWRGTFSYLLPQAAHSDPSRSARGFGFPFHLGRACLGPGRLGGGVLEALVGFSLRRRLSSPVIAWSLRGLPV